MAWVVRHPSIRQEAVEYIAFNWLRFLALLERVAAAHLWQATIDIRQPSQWLDAIELSADNQRIEGGCIVSRLFATDE